MRWHEIGSKCKDGLQAAEGQIAYFSFALIGISMNGAVWQTKEGLQRVAQVKFIESLTPKFTGAGAEGGGHQHWP